MARLTRRQILTTISIVYLIVLTVLAAYALHLANYYSLPIPNVQSALTVALPPLAGIALELIISFHQTLTAQGKLTNSKIFQAVNAAFLVYEVVLATLAGTHIAPLGGLFCPLQDKWKDMRKHRDGKSLQRIQDAFDCCGFNGPQDMAFPFPDKAHGNNWCMVRYERDRPCIEPWRNMERKVAILLMVVPVAVFLWKLALFLAPGLDESWLPSAIRLPRDGSANTASGRSRPAITFHDADDLNEADSIRAEINQLNRDSSLATHIEGGRVRPSPLIQEPENNMWNRE